MYCIRQPLKNDSDYVFYLMRYIKTYWSFQSYDKKNKKIIRTKTMLTNFSSSKSARMGVASWSLTSEISEWSSLSLSLSEPLLLLLLLLLSASLSLEGVSLTTGRLGSEMRRAVSPFSRRIVLDDQVGKLRS